MEPPSTGYVTTQMKSNANGCVRAVGFWWISSIIFVDPPCKYWRKVFNGTRRVLKGDISPFRRIQNFEKRLITFGDTAWNVKKLFEIFSKPEPKFYIENPIQSRENEVSDFRISIHFYWILYRKFRFRFRKFSNNFFTSLDLLQREIRIERSPWKSRRSLRVSLSSPELKAVAHSSDEKSRAEYAS